MATGDFTLRVCLREPIPEIATAAHYLNEAVSYHLSGRFDLADELIRRANIPAIREWTESLWGKRSPYVKYRGRHSPPAIGSRKAGISRMPSSAEKRNLLQRDGYHCRFCGIPVIRHEVRNRIRKSYPDALPWPRKNSGQHAAFQALWAHYDHLLPHAKGGVNELENMVIACAPCNCARMNYTLEEVGLSDPRERKVISSQWDGLERFR